MPKKETQITARIHNYSIPPRKSDDANSLLLTIQASEEVHEDFPIPTKILIPKTDKNQSFLDTIVQSLNETRLVMFYGTYTCTPPNFFSYRFAKARKRFSDNQRALGESAIRAYQGVITIDGTQSYEIAYNCHKNSNLFQILKTF